MNYGGDAADQIVRYSLDGMEHGLRLSGSLAKELAVFFAAVLKDQKKTHGRTHMIRMLKTNQPMKFFNVPPDRLREFCQEAKRHGLLYVIIRDRKNPVHCEAMVYADDAAKMNRIMNNMGLDYVKAESGAAVHEMASEVEKAVAAQEAAKTETVEMPEGEVQFEISEPDSEFSFEIQEPENENFSQAQEPNGENPSESSLRSSDTLTASEDTNKKPSVKQELDQIKQEQAAEAQKRKERSPSKGKGRSAGRKNKKKTRGKGR